MELEQNNKELEELLNKLKGQRWERITGVEDKCLKTILKDERLNFMNYDNNNRLNNHTNTIPYMYDDNLTISINESLSHDVIINGFQALKKLGCLKNLTIIFPVYTTKQNDNNDDGDNGDDEEQKQEGEQQNKNKNKQQNKSQSYYEFNEDLMNKISQELGKIPRLESLIFQVQQYPKYFDNIFTYIHRIPTLKTLKIIISSYLANGFTNKNIIIEYQKGYKHIFNSISKCESLELLKIQLLETSENQFNIKELKNDLSQFKNLKNLQTLLLPTNIEDSEFYDCLGYIISQLPQLKKWSLHFQQFMDQNSSLPLNQLKGLILVSQHLQKLSGFEQLILIFSSQFIINQQAKYLQSSFKLLSQISSLKSLTLRFANFIDNIDSIKNNNDNNNADNAEEEINNDDFLQCLSNFKQIEHLNLIFSSQFKNSYVSGVKELKQLKKYELYAGSPLFHRNNYATQKELVKHIKPLTNLREISYSFNSLRLPDVFRYLTNLVNYEINYDSTPQQED